VDRGLDRGRLENAAPVERDVADQRPLASSTLGRGEHLARGDGDHVSGFPRGGRPVTLLETCGRDDAEVESGRHGLERVEQMVGDLTDIPVCARRGPVQCLLRNPPGGRDREP
jgi:hypothetical protein